MSPAEINEKLKRFLTSDDETSPKKIQDIVGGLEPLEVKIISARFGEPDDEYTITVSQSDKYNLFYFEGSNEHDEYSQKNEEYIVGVSRTKSFLILRDNYGNSHCFSVAKWPSRWEMTFAAEGRQYIWDVKHQMWVSK